MYISLRERLYGNSDSPTTKARRNTQQRRFTVFGTPIQAETLVVATHGILKKTQKTPPKEIKKAEEIRKQYFNNKTKNK